MNHQERLELLAALSRAGVYHFKSPDLEVHFGVASVPVPTPWAPPVDPIPLVRPPAEMNEEANEKLKGLMETIKMDDEALIDKIFPAGAGL